MKLYMKNSKPSVAILISQVKHEGPLILALSVADSLKSRFQFEIVYIKGEVNKDIAYPQILFKRARLQDYAIVWTHCIKSNFLGFYCFIKGIKTVTTVHVFPGKQHFLRYGAVKGFIYTSLYYLSIIVNRSLVFCADSMNTKLFTIFRPNIYFINNCTSFTSRIESDMLYDYVYAGRLSNEKNVVSMLKAFKGRKESLLILGDGPLRGFVEDFIATNKNVSYFGSVPYPSLYFAQSRFYLSMSKVEGLSLSLLESLAQGCTPVLSPIPSHVQVVRDLDLGFIVGDNSSVFNSIAYDRNLVVQRSKDKYSCQITGKKYQDVFESLL